MRDVMPANGVTKGRRLPLVGKLCRVDPDDGQALGVPGFQRLQLREDVQAVNSAIGPEVEEDHAPAEIGETEGLRDVEPLQPLGELRGANGRLRASRHGDPPDLDGPYQSMEIAKRQRLTVRIKLFDL
jgi:hypothetical protein